MTEIAGRIWVGSLTIAKKPTRLFPKQAISDHVREAINYDFEGDDHNETNLEFDLTVDEPSEEMDESSGEFRIIFPTRIEIFHDDPVDSVLKQAESIVTDIVANWYEGMKKFTVKIAE